MKIPPRTYWFLLCVVSSLVLLHRDIAALVSLAWTDNRYSHIVFVPIISVGLLGLNRRRIFREVSYGVRPGLALAALAAALYVLASGWYADLGTQWTLAAVAAALVVGWVAAFVGCYGVRSSRAALFPLALLLLAVPIHPAIVNVAEVALQRSSADVTHVFFTLTSTPVFRDDLIFSLPGVTIEVAEECSGIRSFISLVITALVLGHAFLRRGWSIALCVLLTIPIAIVKNAFRIATLAILGVYVSPDYLHGDLHHRGGPLFSILSLVLLVAVLWALRRLEGRTAAANAASNPSTVVVDERQRTGVSISG